MPETSASKIRVMVIDDFGLASGERGEVEGPVDGLLGRLQPGFESTLSDRLDTRQRRDAKIQCRIESLADFAPESALQGMDIAQPWWAARQRLQGASPQASASDVASLLPEALREDAWGVALLGTSDGGGQLDRLLSQVDLGTSPRQQALDEIDRRLKRQLEALLKSSDWHRLEASWRSLERLHQQLQTLPGVRLEFVSAPQAEAADVFFQDIFQQEYDGDVAEPLVAVVLGYGFDRSQQSFDCLETCARMGESLRIPFLGSLNAAFWGIKRQALLAGLPDLVGRLQGPEYVKWNRLRDEETSLWLGLVVNRSLLRDRWSAGGNSEWTVSDKADLPLWGQGAWLLAAAVARAHAEGGLHLPLTQSEVSDLAEDADGRSVEVVFDDQRMIEVGHCGLIPLVVDKHTNAARFPLAPSFHRPRRFDRDEATRASFFAATLAHQVFASLASHRLQQIAEDLELGLDDSALETTFRRQLLEFLDAPQTSPAADAPESSSQDSEGSEASEGSQMVTEEVVTVEVETPPERPETRLITVRLQPAFAVCGGHADLVLGTVVLVGSA